MNLQPIIHGINSFENEIPIILSLVLLITSATVILEYHELNNSETYPDYFDNVKPYLDSCDPTDYPIEKRGHLKWWFICASEHWLGNAKIIPFIFSSALIPITYFFVSELTKYRTVGLITILLMVSSDTFLNFNTTSTYELSWVLFLILSTWFAIKGNPTMTSIMFILSFFAKPLALIYLPLLMITAWQLAPNNRKEIIFTLGLICGIIISIAIFGGLARVIGSDLALNTDKFFQGLYGWWFYLGASMFLAMTIPLIIYKLIHNYIKQKDKISFVIASFIIGIIISVPLIEGLTDQLNHVYRFIPLVIFSASGIGYIIMNWIRHQSKFYVKYHLN